jgi:tetrahydromethanopterin S-methyltransferase subunit G
MENNNKDNGEKIQMTLGLKQQIVAPEQSEEPKDQEEQSVSAFQKVHHWIYAKFHRKDGSVKGWLMGIVLGIALALIVIAIRMAAAK